VVRENGGYDDVRIGKLGVMISVMFGYEVQWFYCWSLIICDVCVVLRCVVFSVCGLFCFVVSYVSRSLPTAR
jgi:hypothetical protein